MKYALGPLEGPDLLDQLVIPQAQGVAPLDSMIHATGTLGAQLAPMAGRC